MCRSVESRYELSSHLRLQLDDEYPDSQVDNAIVQAMVIVTVSLGFTTMSIVHIVAVVIVMCHHRHVPPVFISPHDQLQSQTHCHDGPGLVHLVISPDITIVPCPNVAIVFVVIRHLVVR